MSRRESPIRLIRQAGIGAIMLATAGASLAQPASDAASAASAPSAAASVASLRRPSRLDLNDPSCSPKYPNRALVAGAHGTTVVQFTVDEHAKVIEAHIVQSSGVTREHRLLDAVTLEAMAGCPFYAGQDDAGRPVGGTFTGAYRW